MCFPLIDLRERGNGKEGASHILNTFSGRDPYRGSGIDLPEGMWASAGGGEGEEEEKVSGLHRRWRPGQA